MRFTVDPIISGDKMRDFSRWGVPAAQAVPPQQMPSGYPSAPGLVSPSVYPGIPVAQSVPQGPRPPVQKGLFKGRLSRRSYWIYVLATMLIRSLVGIAFCCNINALQFLMLLELFLFLPDMVAGVKRSHDTGKSGLLVLLLAMPRGFECQLPLCAVGQYRNSGFGH